MITAKHNRIPDDVSHFLLTSYKHAYWKAMLNLDIHDPVSFAILFSRLFPKCLDHKYIILSGCIAVYICKYDPAVSIVGVNIEDKSSIL